MLQSETLTLLEKAPVNGGARILIVEDEPLNRALLEQQLAQLGYNQVDSTTNGLEAIKHCMSRSYDLIVTDLGMPLLGGESCCRRCESTASPRQSSPIRQERRKE